MPGEGLNQLPNISMEVVGDTDEEEVGGRRHGSSHQDLEEDELRSMSPSKRARLMADVSVVPSGEVKRNSGGRGKERYRARKSGMCTCTCTKRVLAVYSTDVVRI